MGPRYHTRYDTPSEVSYATLGTRQSRIPMRFAEQNERGNRTKDHTAVVRMTTYHLTITLYIFAKYAAYILTLFAPTPRSGLAFAGVGVN